MIYKDLDFMMEYLQLTKEASDHICDPEERDCFYPNCKPSRWSSTSIHPYIINVCVDHLKSADCKKAG